jgi:hypothetical protein
MIQGNNFMILNKLIKNVFIRWDADHLGARTLASWNVKVEDLIPDNLAGNTK